MTAVALLVGIADSLGSCVTHSRADAVGVDLLADEGGHGFGVILETR